MQAPLPPSADRLPLHPAPAPHAQQPPHCRICLEQQGQLSQLPCQCKSDLALVHSHCFAEWISRRYAWMGEGYSNRSNHRQVLCEICRREITIQYVEGWRVRDCGEIGGGGGWVRVLVGGVVLGLLVFLLVVFGMAIVADRRLSSYKIGVYVFLILLGLIILGVNIKILINILIKKYISQLKFISKK